VGRLGSIHETADKVDGAEKAFLTACVTIRPQRWLSPVGAVENAAI
jgi:hypothetical protein